MTLDIHVGPHVDPHVDPTVDPTVDLALEHKDFLWLAAALESEAYAPDIHTPKFKSQPEPEPET